MIYPAQAAESLNIATSTLRKYASRFSNHLSQAAQRQHRRYSENDLIILRRICILRENGVLLDDISAHLAEEDLSTPIPLMPFNSPDLAPDLAAAIDANRAQIAGLQDSLHTLTERSIQAAPLPDAVPDFAIIEELTRCMQQVKDLTEDLTQLRGMVSDLDKRVTLALEDVELIKARSQTAAPATGMDTYMTPKNISDIKTDLMQLKAELFRTTERQKNLEGQIKQNSDQGRGWPRLR